MIIGIGTDIVKIDRIKKAVHRWDRKFLDRIYTKDELSFCFLKKNPFPHLAGRFAAKEAAIKALSSIASASRTPPASMNKIKHLNMGDIEINNDKKGAPYIIIKNPYLIPEKMNFTIHVTISHEKTYAVATVVIEKVDSG
jgi:holo-[acyl-carrier protein] synthase